MWAKILAGAVAAVAVGGTGTYFAMNDTCHSCPFSSQPTDQQVSSDCACCAMAPDTGTCTGESACTSSEAVAACAGPAALISTTKTKSTVGACCSE